MKSVKEFLDQIESSTSSVTKHQLKELIVNRALGLEKENTELRECFNKIEDMLRTGNPSVHIDEPISTFGLLCSLSQDMQAHSAIAETNAKITEALVELNKSVNTVACDGVIMIPSEVWNTFASKVNSANNGGAQ